MPEQNKQLCLDLLYSESEGDVIKHLKAAGYWDDPSVWRFYGDNENNWATIGGQQSSPAAAMVEKMVNAIDAVLMRECLKRNINPEGPAAPQSIPEALDQFFGIRNGNLANVGAVTRSALAREIGLIATGAKQKPSYTVFDCGEGQTPAKMPDTLLSINKSNKLRIPFVQGKFNMGATGALPFCGDNRLQLVISRRCPDIAEENDTTSLLWGFTVVRRQDPAGGERSSIYTYLAPRGQVLTFSCDSLCMPRGYADETRAPSIDWGTVIKMYEYKMTGLLTNIKLDLYYAISLLLPKPGLPVRFYEFRNYKQESPEATMAGLHVRLEDSRRDNIEDGFPSLHSFPVGGKRVNVHIYAFRRGQQTKYRSREGVVFTINGQTHGHFQKSFFERNSVKMQRIADSILVIVDASNITARTREDLFMNSRDRLRRGALYSRVERELTNIVRDDPLLRALRDRRRREDVQERFADSKPLRKVMGDILKKSPSLAALLNPGLALADPLRTRAAEIKTEYYPNDPPTFFKLRKKYRRPKRNERPINRKTIRIQYDTDAPNGYDVREENAGVFTLTCNAQPFHDFSLHFLNCVATLNVGMPEDARVGDCLEFESALNGVLQTEPFQDQFNIHITPAVKDSKGNSGRRQPPAGGGKGNRQTKGEIALPRLFEVRQPKWVEYDFDKYSAMTARGSGDIDDPYDFYINMHNAYLIAELDAYTGDFKTMEEQFKTAMALIGLAALQQGELADEKDSDDSQSPSQRVERITAMVAPVILPIINGLGDHLRD